MAKALQAALAVVGVPYISLLLAVHLSAGDDIATQAVDLAAITARAHFLIDLDGVTVAMKRHRWAVHRYLLPCVATRPLFLTEGRAGLLAIINLS
jgi:hypothetical protein